MLGKTALCLDSLQVMAAQDGRFVSLQDKQVQHVPKRWAYGAASCRGAWPPLWGCMCTYPTAAQVLPSVAPPCWLAHQRAAGNQSTASLQRVVPLLIRLLLTLQPELVIHNDDSGSQSLAHDVMEGVEQVVVHVA